MKIMAHVRRMTTLWHIVPVAVYAKPHQLLFPQKRPNSRVIVSQSKFTSYGYLRIVIAY